MYTLHLYMYFVFIFGGAEHNLNNVRVQNGEYWRMYTSLISLYSYNVASCWNVQAKWYALML